jgi:hypothetical protein
MSEDAKGTDVQEEVSSTSQGLDPEHFDPDSENVIETVSGDEAGGIDISTGGAREADKADPVPTEEGEEAGSEKEEGAGEDKQETDAAKAEPYHKDPAWQRIIKERDEALKNFKVLSERVEALETSPDPKTKSIDDLTDEELIELQEDDPQAYREKLKESIYNKVKQDLTSELLNKEKEERTDRTYNEYSDTNPDNEDGTGFVQMWESGKLQKYIDQNPGNNPISAHMALTVEDRIKSAVDAAVAKVKEEVTKNQRARVITDGLGDGPAHVPIEEDGLKNTKSQGGLVSAIADKLRKTRQAAV